MTPTALIACRDCAVDTSQGRTGWLRCPNCSATFCPECARAHHESATGECDSTAACTACGYTCLVDV
jgi:hypothetical protein